MTHTYIALTDGSIVETNVRTHDLEKLFQEEWFRVPVRGYTGARYRLYLLRSADVRCAWEQPAELKQPWKPPQPDPAAALIRAYEELIADAVGLNKGRTR